MASKFYNLDTDTTLGGNNSSDIKIASQKAIKTYVDDNKGDTLPSQTGNSGKFLTTNGTTANWATITIPTVNNATLTIQKNGTDVQTFTANASSDVTCNITVPTDLGDLSNNAGYTKNTGTVTSVNNISTDNAGNVAIFPSQSGQNGKFLQTNEGILYWEDALPSQSGNSGKFLTTNGTTASWGDMANTIPLATSTSYVPAENQLVRFKYSNTLE